MRVNVISIHPIMARTREVWPGGATGTIDLEQGRRRVKPSKYSPSV